MGIVSGKWILGVDGGGTGCRVALRGADERGLVQASGGPANFTTDPEATVRNVLSAVREAASKSALTAQGLQDCVAHIGLAGIMNPADGDVVAGAMPFRHVAVSDDRTTFVAGALGERDGILAAIGTGTIVAARMGGSTRRFGGWGHHLSDQASGGWLGLNALRCAILAHDGLAEHSDLTRALMDRFGGDPVAVVQFAARANPGDYATFAPAVVDAADSGDVHARALMREGAAYLESCFHAAGLGDNSILCLAGGLGPLYAPYLDTAFRVRIQPPVGTALDGALRLAQAALERLEGKP